MTAATLDLQRHAIATAEALRLLDTTLARDPEQHRVPAHFADVDQRAEEARGELQLLAEAFQTAGRSDDAEVARSWIGVVAGIVAGSEDRRDLSAIERWAQDAGAFVPRAQRGEVAHG